MTTSPSAKLPDWLVVGCEVGFNRVRTRRVGKKDAQGARWVVARFPGVMRANKHSLDRDFREG